jgi:hypothetical protein
MFQTKVVQIIKKYSMFGNFIFEKHAIYEKKWKNIVEWGSHR